MHESKATMTQPERERRFSDSAINALADDVLRDGHCILCEHFARDVLARWREAFAPLLERHIEREGHFKNRGPGRYYVTLPFMATWAEPLFYEDPDVLALVERLVGEDFVMCQLATDTPVAGSEYQDVHRDAPPLFPEIEAESPPFQLAVNFPLVDVTLDNGPFEVARGTHMLTKAEGLRRLERGDVALEPVTLALGDVMIRDVRALHRGTPNRSGIPRPMVVIGYSRRWLFRPEVSIRVPRSMLSGISERARHMLRYNPIVDALGDDAAVEIYQAFAY